MSQSDSGSDTPADMEEFGLPSINQDKSNNHEDAANEEVKGDKDEKAGKIRDKAKDLISKIGRPKQMYLSNHKVTKLEDETPTSDSSASARPKNLEINDPRFNYDVILSKGYKLLKKMGNGAYASVFLCEKVTNPEHKYVLKISIGEERMPDTQNEYEILSNLDLYSIPKVKELILDNDYFYSMICMEYSDIDNNVLQYVSKHGALQEREVKLAMKELFVAIDYIHSLDYAHRDVKPDNVLIKVLPPKTEGEPSEVKIILIDYNIAKKAKSYRKSVEESKEEGEGSKFRCNYLTHIASQNSQAPELFKSGYYSESVDIWGAGLVFYTLLTGEKIKRGDEEMMKEQIDKQTKLSDAGKELMHLLFSFDGEKRPTAEEAQEHPWFKE